MFNRKILVIALSLCALPVFASLDNSYVMCKNRKIVRTIRIQKTNDGCVTTYTKAGVDRIVGEGKQINSCSSFLNNIRGNLEKAAWKCKDISEAQVSFRRSAGQSSN